MTKKPEELARNGLKVACDLQGEILKASEKCAKIFRDHETEQQNSLRILVDSFVASVAVRLNTPVKQVTPEISYQIGLSATFVRTYFMASDLLIKGNVVEALVLLRKQIEVLARIFELETNSVADLHGRTPNVKKLLVNGTGRIYGFLSEIAHFSTPEATNLLGINVDAERCGPSLAPIFDQSAFSFMDLSHFVGLRFGQWLLGKFGDWFPGASFEDEIALAGIAISACIDAGVLEKGSKSEDLLRLP